MTPRAVLAVVLIPALTACAQLQSVSPLSKGRSALNEGIRLYDDGQIRLWLRFELREQRALHAHDRALQPLIDRWCDLALRVREVLVA